MCRRKEHDIDVRLAFPIYSGDNELLSSKVTLHNEATLHQVSKQSVLTALINGCIHVSSAPVSQTYTITEC